MRRPTRQCCVIAWPWLVQVDSSCTHYSSPTDSTSTWEPAFFLSTLRQHFESFFHATLALHVTDYVTVSMCQERFCHNSDSNSARQILAAELIFLHSSSELLRSRSHWGWSLKCCDGCDILSQRCHMPQALPIPIDMYRIQFSPPHHHHVV